MLQSEESAHAIFNVNNRFQGSAPWATFAVGVVPDYERVDDATAKLWDQRIKSHNPRYRMFLKHWEQAFMPPTYRSDTIFINTSSEAPVEVLNTEFSKFAEHGRKSEDDHQTRRQGAQRDHDPGIPRRPRCGARREIRAGANKDR